MPKQRFQAGKLFDYWSVPHFLFGTVMALFAVTYTLEPFYMFFVTLCLAIVWEFLEIRFRLREAEGNRSVDVILPLVSFVMTFFLVGAETVPGRSASLLFVTCILYLSLNYFAWRARFDRERGFRN